MNQSPQQVSPESVGRTSQIIASALIMGVVTFGVVAFFIAKGEGPKFPMNSLVAIGFAGLAIVIRFVLPTILVNAVKAGLKDAAEHDRKSYMAGLYLTRMIAVMAVLEAAAFFNLVTYISEKQFWSYGVVAFLLGVMAISFPSQGQFESWAEDMKRDLN